MHSGSLPKLPGVRLSHLCLNTQEHALLHDLCRCGWDYRPRQAADPYAGVRLDSSPRKLLSSAVARGASLLLLVCATVRLADSKGLFI